MKKKLQIADLFCGAGGLSLPFYKRKHKISFALDIDKQSIETFKYNHPDLKKIILNTDIKNIYLNKKSFFLKKKYDLVMGGPPCQGFSTANRQNILKDPRNILYKKFLKFVEITNPKYVLIENVLGIRNKAKNILSKLNSLGYAADYRILQSSDFGIPQNRKRVIFFAVKNKNSFKKVDNFFTFIEVKSLNQNKYFLKDALYGLRNLSPHPIKNNTKKELKISGYNQEYVKLKTNSYIKKINYNKTNKIVFNHRARFNNDRDIKIFKTLPQGADSTHSSIVSIMPYKSRQHIFKDKYFKLNKNKFSKTITAHMKNDCNMYIHPTQGRGLTPREAARIQSFPDDYFFLGPLTKTYMQIGNAVPPLLSKIICEAIEHVNK